MPWVRAVTSPFMEDNMKHLKRTLLVSATLGAAILTLAACGSDKKSDTTSKASGKTTVKLWVTPDSKKFYNTVLADFKKENTTVSVNVIETEDAKAQENVKKDPSKSADVFSMPHDQLRQLVDSGVIQEIPDNYATKIKGENTEKDRKSTRLNSSHQKISYA